MSAHRDELWSAYLDGELSAAEASEFDQSLTPDERERLNAELRVEHALSDALARGGECPDATWSRVKLEMENAGAPQKRLGRRLVRGMAAAGTLAALLLLTFGLLQYAGHRISQAAFLQVAEASVAELAESADMRTNDPARAEQYLQERGFDINVPAISGESNSYHYDTGLVGVRETSFRGDPAAELLFKCCNHPLKIVMARRGTRAAEAMRATAESPTRNDEVQAVSMVGDYVAAVVGKHRAPHLLDLLVERVANSLS
jgi:anti-sigma factor RsiW